jgi:hypothetical protein
MLNYSGVIALPWILEHSIRFSYNNKIRAQAGFELRPYIPVFFVGTDF